MCLAVPGELVSISEKDPVFRVGVVDFGGITKQVNLYCVPEAKLGDYLIVHVGLALNIIDKEEALAIRDDLRKLVLEEERLQNLEKGGS